MIPEVYCPTNLEVAKIFKIYDDALYDTLTPFNGYCELVLFCREYSEDNEKFSKALDSMTKACKIFQDKLDEILNSKHIEAIVEEKRESATLALKSRCSNFSMKFSVIEDFLSQTPEEILSTKKNFLKTIISIEGIAISIWKDMEDMRELVQSDLEKSSKKTSDTPKL